MYIYEELYTDESMQFECWFGGAGFGQEIYSLEEIDEDMFREGIYECLSHEFDFDEEAKQVIEKCGVHESDFDSHDSYVSAVEQKLRGSLQEFLCPIEIECTVDGELFEISEEVRLALEEFYIDFAMQWIEDWIL